MVAPLRSSGASAVETDEVGLLASLSGGGAPFSAGRASGSEDRACASDFVPRRPPGVVPTAVLETGEGASAAELASGLPGAFTWILVRAPTTSDSPASCLVLVDADAPPSAALIAAASCADVAFGVSHSRFTSSLPPAARAGEAVGADEVLVKLSAAAGPTLPPPSWDRVGRIVERLRLRAPRAPILVQGLLATSAFGTASSRDPRSGEGPIRFALSSSPAALFDTRPQERAIVELERPPSAAHLELLEDLAGRAEAALKRPVRISFVVTGEELSVVSIQPLRTSGVAACAIAADLARAGVISRRRALELVSPRDLAAAVPIDVEAPPGATTVKGIAAGAGIAEGFVCLSPHDVLAAARAGLRPIFFAHEIFPDEIDALRACVGVVTVRGGLTGEAAVMARGLSKPCVASGASLALSDGHVRILDGGTFDAGERITIDGSTGLISRGALPRRLGALPPSVAAVFELADSEPGRRVIVRVEHPAHVLTASRLGAREIVLGPPGPILFEALRADRPLEGALEAMISPIFAAAGGSFAAIGFAPPVSPGPLPSPVDRVVTAAELELYEAVVVRCAAAAGIPLERQAGAASPDGVACDPDDILTARLFAASTAD